MDAEGMKRYIGESFAGITAVDNEGDTFFVYDPTGDLPARGWLPFATIVTGDHYDTVSDLSRPGAYRLNIGLTKATYTRRFGAPPTERDEHGRLPTGVDHTATDTLTPHPFYASQYWVSVVNPGEATLEDVREFLAEAYEFAVRKHTNRRSRGATTVMEPDA
jgi:hypothetical protein